MMGRNKNLRESGVTVNSCFTIFGNHEILERQFFLIFVILSEKLETLCMISCEIAKITRVERERDFSI